jgi:N-acetylglutamate synthase
MFAPFIRIFRVEISNLLLSPQSAGFIAHENEKIEGVALCGNDGRYGYIHHLAVPKRTRNKGVGRLLVEACIRLLQKRHIIVMVRENNKASNKFWNRLRFQEVDRWKIQHLKANS